MRRAGINVDQYTARTDLIIVGNRDTFLRDGYFDPEAVMDFLVQQIHAAVAAGYAGMRIFGETSWAARGNIGSERLIEYEAKLNYVVDSEPATIMCPYQRRLFPASVLLGALHTHPSVISGPWAGEDFYYVTPDEFLKPGGSGKQLARLLGTIPQQRAEPGKWEANRTQEDWQHSPAESRAATARLRRIREDERTRLARGLRNELGQALTAIKLEFARWTRELPNGQKSTTADSILSILTGALESVRKMTNELRPGVLDDLGLLAAVEWAAEDLKARTGISVRLQVPEQEVLIEQDLATAVFRMFQDMLSNIADHSGVTEVTIHLWCDGGNLLIEVRHDGDGLGQEQLPTGNSLVIIEMRERARQAGGEFFISTEPGKGTLAGVRIPVIGSQ